MPVWANSWISSARISIARGDSPDSGSSIMRTRGWWRSARAIETRLTLPWDSSRTGVELNSVISKRLISEFILSFKLGI